LSVFIFYLYHNSYFYFFKFLWHTGTLYFVKYMNVDAQT